MTNKEYHDVRESFELAMYSEGVDAATIKTVINTIDDAVDNNMPPEETYLEGPWMVDLESEATFAHDGRTESVIEITNEDHSGTAGYAAGMANAKVIAAAPDLLEACKYVVRYHREHDSGEGELFGLDFVTTCIGAIRKAEGGV